MNVLAIESATGAIGVAVATNDGVVAELTVRSARRHVELLHPAIEHVCALSGLSLRQMDAIAADVGPGMFTGIRVGVSAAKALAMAVGVPTLAVTSLEAIASAAVDSGVARESVVAVVDLRRGEVAWSRRGEVGWGSPAKLAAELVEESAEEVVFAGDGALRYGEVFENEAHPRWRLAGVSLSSPPVASVAVLAVAAVREGLTLEASELAPCYLREADARINWTTRHDAGRGGE